MAKPPKPATSGKTLPEAVEAALNQQRDFENRRATLLGRGTERLTGPLGGVMSRLVGPTLLRQVLEAADHAAGMTIPKSATSHNVNDLPACEEAALSVQAWAQGLNAATGGAAGFFGAVGLTADIPATIGLAARNVRATGVSFGFDGIDPEEKAFRILVLELAATSAEDRRKGTISRINRLSSILSQPGSRVATDVAVDWVNEKVMDRVARQLGVSLAGRKAGQVVPIAGGVVAATINASFQVDVARAARYAYRQRWLMSRQLLSAPDLDEVES